MDGDLSRKCDFKDAVDVVGDISTSFWFEEAIISLVIIKHCTINTEITLHTIKYNKNQTRHCYQLCHHVCHYVSVSVTDRLYPFFFIILGNSNPSGWEGTQPSQYSQYKVSVLTVLRGLSRGNRARPRNLLKPSYVKRFFIYR